MDWGKIKITRAGIPSVARWNWLCDQVRSAFIQDVVGGTWQRGPGGTSIYVRPGGSGVGGDASHPFKVLTRPKPEAEGEYEAMVVLDSSLYKSLRPNDKVTITGLDTWFDLIGTDAIWLGIVFNISGTITSASIDSWGQGDDFEIDEDAWSGNNGYCEDDGEPSDPFHQTSRVLIARSEAGDDGQPVLTQEMFHHQVLRDVNIDGRSAKYPFAHQGGYPV